MELRRNCGVLALLACVALVWLLPSTAWAGTTAVGVGPIDAVTKAVVDSAKGWIPTLQNYARGVFVGLAVIQMGWIGVRHALSGNPDIGGALGAAALEFVTLGFFAVLISEGPGWAESIVLSLQEAGRVAAGNGTGQTPQQILDEIAALGVKVIEDLSLLNAITSGLAMALACLGVLGLTALIAGLILVGWVQAWVVVGAGSILLGLGGSTWTRSLATNYLRHALGAGVKLMVLELLSGVLLGHIKAWVDEANAGQTFSLELLVHVLLSLTVMTIMILSIPAYVSSIVTGAAMHGGEAMLTRAAAAVAFIAAGKAMGAGRGSATAGNAAGRATGGLEAPLPQTSAPGLLGGAGRGTGGPAPAAARGRGGAAAPGSATSASGGGTGAEGAAAALDIGAPSAVGGVAAGAPAPAGEPSFAGGTLGSGVGGGGARPGAGGRRPGSEGVANGLERKPNGGGTSGGAAQPLPGESRPAEAKRDRDVDDRQAALSAARAPVGARPAVGGTNSRAASTNGAAAASTGTGTPQRAGAQDRTDGSDRAGEARAPSASAAGGGVPSAAPGLARGVGAGSAGDGGVGPKASAPAGRAPAAGSAGAASGTGGGAPSGNGAGSAPAGGGTAGTAGGARPSVKSAGAPRTAGSASVGARAAEGGGATASGDAAVRSSPAPRPDGGGQAPVHGATRPAGAPGRAASERREYALSGGSDEDGEEVDDG